MGWYQRREHGSPNPNSEGGRTNNTEAAKQIHKEMAQSRVPVTMRDFFFDDPFFKNSWDDFDKVRERMFSESRDMWKRFDDDFRNMACMQNNIMLESSKDATSSVQESQNKESTNENRDLMRQDSKTRYENGWMFPRRWMLPGLHPEMTNGLDIFKSKDNDEIRVKEDESKIEVSLDTSQYRPDELKVSVDKRVVTVEGKHEEKAEDGSKMVSRMFSKKYTLPPDAKAEDLSLTCLLMGSLSSLLLRRIWLSNKFEYDLKINHVNQPIINHNSFHV